MLYIIELYRSEVYTLQAFPIPIFGQKSQVCDVIREYSSDIVTFYHFIILLYFYCMYVAQWASYHLEGVKQVEIIYFLKYICFFSLSDDIN